MRALICTSAITAALLFSPAGGAMAAQPAAQLEQMLLVEPQWTWQSGDGPDVAVWFEQDGDRLILRRCPAAAPDCRQPVRVTPGGLEIVASGSRVLLRRVAATPPMFAGDRGQMLFPAWVVPTASSRTGH